MCLHRFHIALDQIEQWQSNMLPHNVGLARGCPQMQHQLLHVSDHNRLRVRVEVQVQSAGKVCQRKRRVSVRV